MAKFGKDHPAKSSEGFISGALTGKVAGDGPEHGYQDTSTSNEIENYHVDRPEQSIKTAFGMDNVGRVYGRYPTSMKDVEIPGGVDNLKHSLTGTSAVNEEVGAVGKLKHIILPHH